MKSRKIPALFAALAASAILQACSSAPLPSAENAEKGSLRGEIALVRTAPDGTRKIVSIMAAENLRVSYPKCFPSGRPAAPRAAKPDLSGIKIACRPSAALIAAGAAPGNAKIPESFLYGFSFPKLEIYDTVCGTAVALEAEFFVDERIGAERAVYKISPGKPLLAAVQKGAFHTLGKLTPDVAPGAPEFSEGSGKSAKAEVSKSGFEVIIYLEDSPESANPPHFFINLHTHSAMKSAYKPDSGRDCTV